MSARPGDETAAAKPRASKGAGRPAAARARLMPKTHFPKHGELAQWRLVDATDVPLGRLSSHIAMLLMGKNKAAFTPFADVGACPLSLSYPRSMPSS